MAKEYLEAKEIVSKFFQETGRRPTKATFGQAINQASYLLKAGFTKDEIIQGIEYCVKNPPPKGFNSLGWLSYTLEDILIKVKAQQAKKELDNININITEGVEYGTDERYSECEGGNDKSRFRKNYNFELFK